MGEKRASAQSRATETGVAQDPEMAQVLLIKYK